jgi:hypothetical protein
MPKAASLRNLQPWKPGQSGNPNGRPRAPRFTERDQHVIVAALAGTFDEATRQGAIRVLRAALTTPRTALKALEFAARLNGELDSRSRHQETVCPGEDDKA